MEDVHIILLFVTEYTMHVTDCFIIQLKQAKVPVPGTQPWPRLCVTMTSFIFQDNHLSGLKQTLLKLSFITVDDLVKVRYSNCYFSH